MTQGPKLTFLGKLMIFLFVAACFYGAYSIFSKDDLDDPIDKKTGDNTPSNVASHRDAIKIGIAYGTEKRLWLEWAVNQFAKTDDI
ncbi:hypothetical protein [Thioflexithrix psekupsensis]|uniref:Uncharacterized protein n=1 Tax=Thioflexithrix psekupsensis TaxID=1570016 RepID=A0A251XD35_9GAMM|nr:hypothetical protein [Thioflexithrix psekupsensis]OUD16241.1 hypothetical protein TPSD3_00520 [Thioflexithrix psekupsensis]